MSTFIVPPPRTLAIALGANIASQIGPPATTLVAARESLTKIINEWCTSLLKENTSKEDISQGIHYKWSPLFETKPIGGPTQQSNYINAVVLINGPILEKINPTEVAILDLLERTILIEKSFGRNKQRSIEKWGPRTIDLDILVWGDLQVNNKKLTLPHPRIIDRNFVITPLSCVLSTKDTKPIQLPPRKGWSE